MLIDEISKIPVTVIESSIPQGTTVSLILEIIKKAPQNLKSALSNVNLSKSLNENSLTRLLVEEIDKQIRLFNLPFGVKNQYTDNFFGTKGIPDFYFHSLEIGTSAPAFFVVEAKRLPAPTKIREKEYVIGETLNKKGIKESSGGIERFKIEKHGFGINENGMIGFIEAENFTYWLALINNWIEELSKTHPDWSLSEQLVSKEIDLIYSYMESIVIRKSGSMKLHHIWIIVTQ